MCILVVLCTEMREEAMGARKKEALERFNRDNILTAAKELFELNGIEHTTMDDIARQADYSKSTIYVYFKSKEDIYNSIVSDYMSLLTQDIELSLASQQDFKKSYLAMCNCLAYLHSRYPKYYASLLGEEKTTNAKKGTGQKADLVLDHSLEALIDALLEKGVKQKKIPPNRKNRQTIIYLWSGVSGIIRVADKRREGLEKYCGLSREKYLSYAFELFYQSLIGG